MGTFLGHSVTGSFFFAMGYFFFLRSLGARCLESLRTKDIWLCMWPFFEVIGGMVYSFGEWWFMDNGFHIGHMQHFLMATMFTLAGLGTLLHQLRVLRPIGFALLGPAQWMVLAILFYIHEQDNRYLKFGHAAIASLFFVLFFSQTAEVLIGQHTNPSHHIARIAALDYQDRHQSIRSTNPEYSRLAPLYTNRKVYGTIFPMISGLLLMMAGTWDWDLAFPSKARKGTPEWDQYAGMTGLMNAEASFIAHMISNFIVCLITALIVKKIDDWCCDGSSVPLAQRDEHVLFLGEHDKRPIASSDGEDDQKAFLQYATSIEMQTPSKLS